MSTEHAPGMSKNEEAIEHCAEETRKQADRANYPHQPIPLHEKAPATAPGHDETEPETAPEAEQQSPRTRTAGEVF
jgi:hypothetical protein